ncbi:hypothetical protein [Terrabacter sp. MAHUQ-38]|uniref:hypothetical protein n=1 Tax=unclassified Terrabacter TaxID=2630222 RepID=UPI00165E677E|nr:hypothetical protein [Terrabacter sp. MAHUQ-38]MBC9819718.1 hypothetical protein [Terrabacter sp. MAHUQ-38]
MSSGPLLICAFLLAAVGTAVATVRLGQRRERSRDQVMLCSAITLVLVLGSLVASAKGGYLAVAHL